MEDQDLQQELTGIREQYQQEYEKLEREIKESEINAQQLSTDIEKLGQREAKVSGRVHDFETNLDRYEKADVKNIYSSLLDMRVRLQMMRANLEQSKLKQESMRERRELVGDFVELIDQLIKLGISGGGNGRGGGEEFNEHDLVTNIIQVQEEEKERIALQMHDGPAQSMSNLVLRAEICHRLLNHNADQASSELTSLKTAINSSLQDIRKFIFDLRPMTLDDLGLVPTIRRFASEFGESYNIEINVMENGLSDRLARHYEITLFRFIQEALNNIQKHSRAKKARVVLTASEGQLQIIIEDEGEGFDINILSDNAHNRRNKGIPSMKQHIEMLLHGELGIQSTPGQGTRVVANVPIQYNTPGGEE